MKILIRNSDNVVIYAQADLALDTEAHGDGWRDPKFNTSNATLADATLPPHWTGAVWSYVGGVWAVVDTARNGVIVAEQKAAKWEAIKAERDRRKGAGYKVGTLWFHSDADSRIQQIGLVIMAASVPAGLQWKTLDGSFVAMTPVLAGQIFNAAAANDQAIFAKAEQHKAAMEASADPAGYNFTTGWPAVYGG